MTASSRHDSVHSHSFLPDSVTGQLSGVCRYPAGAPSVRSSAQIDFLSLDSVFPRVRH